jgi:hypothetical protein
MYQMKNATHDTDCEKAQSVVANFTLPSVSVILKSPYLNKKMDEEPDLNFTAIDLFNLSQITPRSKELFHSKRLFEIESIINQ